MDKRDSYFTTIHKICRHLNEIPGQIHSHKKLVKKLTLKPDDISNPLTDTFNV